MRQFLAAELPPELRDGVDALQRRIRVDLAGWRWLRPESIHLTARFLGEVGPDLDRCGRSLWRRAAAASGPFRLRLGRIGRFPPRGAPRVLWVAVEEVEPGGALAALARALELAAREAGHGPEDRPFRPHLTLARRNRSGRCATPDDAIAGCGEGWIRRLVLYESRLEPSGARYTALESLPLGAPADAE